MKCFMDFEANGQKNMEITQFGAVLTTDSLDFIDSFTELVKPKNEITEFVENLTNITNKTVKNADSFVDVLIKFNNWLNIYSKNKKIDFYVWGLDFKTLKENSQLHKCVPLFNSVFPKKNRNNYQLIVSKQTKFNNEIMTKALALSNMKELLDLPKKVQHDALSDAYDLYEIYKKIEVEHKSYNETVLKRIYQEKLPHIQRMKEEQLKANRIFFDSLNNIFDKEIFLFVDKNVFKFLKDGPGVIFNDIEKNINNTIEFSRKKECVYNENIYLKLFVQKQEDGNITLNFKIYKNNKEISTFIVNSNEKNKSYIKKFLTKFL